MKHKHENFLWILFSYINKETNVLSRNLLERYQLLVMADFSINKMKHLNYKLVFHLLLRGYDVAL